jgi:hypothetical protein
VVPSSSKSTENEPVYHVPDWEPGAFPGLTPVLDPSAEFDEIVLVPEGLENTWAAELVIFVGSESPVGFVFVSAVFAICQEMGEEPVGCVFVAEESEFCALMEAEPVGSKFVADESVS